MNSIKIFVLFPVVFFLMTCDAGEQSVINKQALQKLLKHYFKSQATLVDDGRPMFRVGDFNGDGSKDIAVLFLPKSKPAKTSQVKLNMPWVYSEEDLLKPYRKSLVIFHGNKGGWMSSKTHVFVLLSTRGALETPSFELLITKKGDRDYKDHLAWLPIKVSSDIIIIPTEAGIDTYIYWDKSGYKLFEPDEIP